MALRLSAFLRQKPINSELRPLCSCLIAYNGEETGTLGTSTSLRPFTTSSSLDFRLSSLLLSEPLKKKKKIDPELLHKREKRMTGKLERALARLGEFADKLKPVDEFQVPRRLRVEREIRTRNLEPLAFEESERRAKLKNAFNETQLRAQWKDYAEIAKVQKSQKKAMAELRLESESLYQKALETDDFLLPLKSPILTATPPVTNYEAPDGSHADVSKTFEYDVDVKEIINAHSYLCTPRWKKKQDKMEEEDDSDDEKDKKKKKKKKRN